MQCDNECMRFGSKAMMMCQYFQKSIELANGVTAAMVIAQQAETGSDVDLYHGYLIEVTQSLHWS